MFSQCKGINIQARQIAKYLWDVKLWVQCEGRFIFVQKPKWVQELDKN